MKKSKFEEFHISFIKNLVFVGLVTIISMISVHYLVFSLLENTPNTPIINYTESQIKP